MPLFFTPCMLATWYGNRYITYESWEHTDNMNETRNICQLWPCVYQLDVRRVFETIDDSQ